MAQSIMKLGTFLAEARKSAGLTLRAVEKEVGISNAYLSQLEHGKILVPAPQNLHKLAELYRVPYELLMELAGHPLPSLSETGSPSFKGRITARMSNITQDEEEALVEYLQFLRARKRGRS